MEFVRESLGKRACWVHLSTCVCVSVCVPLCLSRAPCVSECVSVSGGVSVFPGARVRLSLDARSLDFPFPSRWRVASVSSPAQSRHPVPAFLPGVVG